MSSRETELYKDKVEVSLDGRQIFYLFFGGAMIVGVVFVLGVLVGRRVEARGHVERARTHTAADPLAALDRLEGNGGLSFRGALTGKAAASDVENTIGELEKARTAAPDKKAVRSEPKPDAKTETKTDAKTETKTEAKTDAKAKTETKPEPKLEAKTDAKAKTEAKTEAKAEAKAKTETKKYETASAEGAGPVTRPDKVDEPKEVKTRFTLQLSSFQDKAEAESFLSTVKAKGYEARITEAQVDGKDWYRVRMGTYRSMEAATTAKSEFEKSANKSASIMKL